MDSKELFENNCFPLFWCEDEEHFEAPKKDMTILLAELEDIKNRIDELSAKEWHLARLMQLNKQGIKLPDLG